MTLTVKTNLSSLIVRKNLATATNALTRSVERMSTGFKINHAADNAAGLSIATNMDTKLRSLEIATENAQMGIDMLDTVEGNYSLITEHLQRIRDLTEQAANGTYGSESRKAIKSEIGARLEEINRIAESAEYNDNKLMSGASPFGTSGLTLQVGINSQTYSKITLANTIFASAKISSTDLFGTSATVESVSAACSGQSTAAGQLTNIDTALKNLSKRATVVGAAQNKLQSAMSSIATQSENLTSSLSTIRDSDVASESSNYIQAQILQQASATLLATANQLPSLALNLM